MRYGLRRKGETICSLCASPLKEDHPLDEVLHVCCVTKQDNGCKESSFIGKQKWFLSHLIWSRTRSKFEAKTK